MKKCSRCNSEKPFEDFFRDKSKKDGHQSRCKACVAEHNKSPRRKATKAKYQKSAKGKAVVSKYLKSDKGKSTLAKIRDSQEYKDWYSEYNKSPRRKASKASYRKSHRGREVDAKYRSSPKGRDAAANGKHARRALLANAPSDNWKVSEVHSEANGKCLYCGISVTLNEMHADHFIPLAKGGSNLRENIVCSCASCNLKKSDKMPEDFIGETL